MTRIKLSFALKIAAITFYLLLAFFLSRAQVTSDFSSSDDNWKFFDNNSGATASVAYNATGGNPGGYISVSTTFNYLPLYFRAPAKFLGNQGASYNQTLTFDMKVSTAGTDNTNGDVVITGTGGTLYFQLPTKPSSTGWSSYTISLNESVWHYGGIASPAPNQIQMKQVLSNITNFQIRLKYLATTGGTYTSQLDNVVLNQQVISSPPTVTSISPSSALAGTSITINGTNFNTTPAQNAVFFGGVSASVTSASSTKLTVTVPKSAGFAAVTVVNLGTGLQASSSQNFNPLFDNNKDFGGQIIPASMGRGYNVTLPLGATSSNGFGTMDKGDFDGDGWTDLVTTETSSGKIYVFQNLGTGGAVGASSFSSAITLPSLASIPGGGPSLAEVLVADVDSDGKLDVAASTSGNYQTGTGFLAVYRNTSTTGNISFANPVFFPYAYYSALTMATGDLDGDGRTDFAFTGGTSPGNLFLSRNQSTPGNIDFAYGGAVSAAATSGYSDVVIGDLTGDGKPEIVCPGYNATVLSIYQNNSTPGTISMGTAFTVPAVVSYTNKLVMADFDADNKQDMAWSVYGAQYVYLTKNNYSGGVFDATAFGATIQIVNKLANPLGINAGDINADGKPDIVMSGYSDLAILQNVGSAGNLNANSFLPTTLCPGSPNGANIFGLSPVVADVDGDNKPEAIFVSSAANATAIYIYHNESFPVPVVNSVTPASANTGAAVSLNGNYMYTGNVSPTVRLNKSLTTLSGTPSNALTALTNPAGGISGKFNVTDHGLTGFSPVFNFAFNTNRSITTSSFGPSINFPMAFNPRDVLDVADFDDDGKVDVVISDNNGVGIYQNTSAPGSITASSLTLLGTTYTAGANAYAIDIDGDGKIDLNSGSGIWQNNSASTISFAASVYASTSNPSGVANADFNKDGKIDVATTNGSANVNVFENKSSKGAFLYDGLLSTYFPTAVTLAHPTGSGFSGNNNLVAADFDGDGYDDVAAVSASSTSIVFFRNLAVYGPISSSSFSAGTIVATASNPYGITANDFDGDGKIDVAVVHYSSTAINVYLNTSTIGTISFAAPINLSGGQTFGYNISSQDLDGDGKAEIVTTRNPNPGTPSFSIFQNSSTPGTLSFSAAITYTLTKYPQALAFADINSDSKPDILIVASVSGANALMVFENKMITPVITVDTQPTPVYSVCDGATPTITTAASGTTNIIYQWQIFNVGTGAYVDLTNTGGYSNVGTASMTINSTGNFGNGTYRCKISGDYATTVYTNTVSFTVNAVPTAPTAPNVSNCGPGSLVITASGGINGQYLWYDQSGLITGQNNSTYTTPVISSTTSYSVAITNGTCVSTKTNVNATILTAGCATINIGTQPADVSTCPGNVAMFTTAATGTTNLVYQWQFSSDGGTTFNDIANNTNYSNVTTTALSVNTTNSFGAGLYRCKVDGDFANTTLTNNAALSFNSSTCAAPVINAEPLATQVGGTITLNLVPLITTPNLDVTSLQITSPPSSGATASIDAQGVLTINYTGKAFVGADQITIKACDKNGQCATQSFAIEVAGDIVVYNGVSPNGKNPSFVIQYIDVLPQTKNNNVYIFDRWENQVWHGTNYDNSSVVFTGVSDSGADLPSGVYFYKIEFSSGVKTRTGFISLRRQ